MNIEEIKFSKEELKELQIDNHISIQQEVQNFAIFAINELCVIRRDSLDYTEEQSAIMKKKLKKLLADIVALRKTCE